MFSRPRPSGQNRFGNSYSRSSRPSGFQRPGSFRGGNRRPANGRNRFSERIDPSLFIKKANPSIEKPEAVITHTFDDFAFSGAIKGNLRHREFTIPTPIQDQAINHIIEGKDIIGLANTGTGKTAAFLLPLIDKVAKNRSEKVLIVAPTRELAMQIENEFREFSFGMRIFSAACVGGMPIFKQINNLRREPNFVIGTPGRLKDLTKRGIIKLQFFQNVVVDEVDRMLDMGFIDDIKQLLGQMPEDRQTLFFSATLPEKIQRLVNQFLQNPVTVAVKTGNTPENVDQDIVRVRDRAGKFDQLQDLLSQDELKKVLIFIDTKAEVERLTSNLVTEGFKADSIQGDKRQRERERALKSFRNNDISILVATDVAARGLDIDNVSHVINYTVPQTYNDYVHRIGRTGRGNKKGFALTFVE